jgi:hypothetical protein
MKINKRLGIPMLMIGVVLGMAFTHKPPIDEIPPAPVCTEANTVTSVAAVWTDPKPAVTHKEHQHGTWVKTGHHHHGNSEHEDGYVLWGTWQNGSCTGQGYCNERTVEDSPAVAGSWSDPVCTKTHPACDPQGEGCKDDTMWENIKGAFPSNATDLYQAGGVQSMDINWTAVEPCAWDYGLEMCKSPLSVVQIKVRAKLDAVADKMQGAFVVLVDGLEYPAQVVEGVDGSKWYTFRAQVGSADKPLYEGIIVIHSKDLIILDELGKTAWKPWSATNGVGVYNNSAACDDPADLGDVYLAADGKKMLTKYPGMADWTTAHFLMLNGVSQADADAWVAGDWHDLAVGQSLALPDLFAPALVA